ncbi:hypothetical protein CBP51_17960 [Cellvibrio mixtus]|jgi:hypothetical protein|uniref:DNA topoisomerase I n=1 Tax=Cellvibrio mixtus TaxID=39650 RepID=A0A266Q583_9GAMM|nr:hypothetical protein [Cellvibrio mixtus]OZY85034.1 hypothetical protein CBP51_17960 [Cellvibrio mixtus]
MTLIAILFLLMLLALVAVSIINRIQLRQRERRLQQRRLRIQAEGVAEIVSCLEQTLPNRMITKHINDMIAGLQQQMLALEDKNPELLEQAIQKTEAYSEELLSSNNRHAISYQRESDAQIAKTQLHLTDAMHLITQLAAQGTINETELSTYLSELRWAHLMVAVMSYIGQGDKSVAISDRFSAQAFYRKAQQHLMESMHQDPRRLKMIKELSEMVDGARVGLSRELRDPTAAAMG